MVDLDLIRNNYKTDESRILTETQRNRVTPNISLTLNFFVKFFCKNDNYVSTLRVKYRKLKIPHFFCLL